MKKYLFAFIVVLAVLFFCKNTYAQPGIVHSIAGGGASTADGVPASSVHFLSANSFCFDRAGNLYVADVGANKVRKIDAVTGLVRTVAGNGIAGMASVGVPATNSALQIQGGGICVDAAGNLYIADPGNWLLHKVDPVSGIMTNVAGNISPTASGDGVPATNTPVCPYGIALDPSENLVIVEGSQNTIRKIDRITGIITRFAGNGVTGYSGDGGPATNAELGDLQTIAIDVSGNVYFNELSGHIRKVSASTGIISTAAMTSSVTLNTCIAVDFAKNVYYDDSHDLYKVDAITGVTTSLGKITSGGSGLIEGVPISSIFMLQAGALYVDMPGNIYFSQSDKIYKISSFSPGVMSFGENFMVYPLNLCNGPQITVKCPAYTPGEIIVTHFGDGHVDTTAVLMGATIGYCIVNHGYALSGSYTIKHILYSSGLPIDSVSYPFDYSFCRSLSVRNYLDENNSCSKEDNETYIRIPLNIEVDSNGIATDLLSVTSGFTYNAYGNPNDVYSFKVGLPLPGDIAVTCPSSGLIIDTITSAIVNSPVKYFGMSCGAGTMFDFAVHTTFRAGRHRADGTVTVTNPYCGLYPGILTVNISPKYSYYPISPSPLSVTSNSITWDISGFSSAKGNIPSFHFQGEKPVSIPNYLPGDTVYSSYSMTPLIGDANPANNVAIRIDTIKSSYDPNYLEVAPDNCIGSRITLEYTIHFENTGNDTAHDIYVLDTLSNNVDPSTLKMAVASADMFISKCSIDGYTVVKFDFPGINLLDSSHYGECDGMLVFTVNIRDGLANETPLYNSAGIYFDDNPVVPTNKVENLTGCWPAAIPSVTKKEEKMVLFPNPATAELTIKTDQNTYTSFTITNTMGQQMMQQDITTAQTKVNVRSLPNGLYIVTLRGEQGSVVEKFVKW